MKTSTRPRQGHGRSRAIAAALLGAVLLATGPTVASASPSSSIDPNSGWSSATPVTRGGQDATPPETYRLDQTALQAALASAPLENTAAASGALPVVAVPGADGALHRFSVVESPVMEPALAAKVPFKSYAGTSVDEPGSTVRLDYSPALGFHATVRSPAGSWNVDPARSGDTTTHVARTGAATSSPALKDVEDQADQAGRAAAATPRAQPAPGSIVQQRVYRFAMANDPAYATLVGAANVDSIKAALTNRVNEVYNDDLAIKVVLVANNDLLDFNTAAKFTGANGPCGAGACFTPTGSDDLSACTAEKRDQAAVAITKVIGRDNYDIGQILDPGGNGGIALIGSVGQDALKGAGCSGAGSGKGDALAVQFLAHEMGHQFGAFHTFSSASCGGYATETDVEPGSGSTIMSYSGTCAEADNIQNPADPYFSETSIRQIQDYTTSTIAPASNGGQPAENGGSTVVATTNHSPVVTVPAAVAIPVRTPFTLSGAVTDPDAGQTPVSAWEQDDAGGIRPLMDNNKPNGALFRMFGKAAVSPTYDDVLDAPGLNEATPAGSTRTFPDQAQIAAGNTNAAAGTCPTGAPVTQTKIECFAEFLPTSARTLHFALTARDRFPSGGGTTRADTTVTVAGTTPFRVTNAAASVVGNGSYGVTWNVAGTTAAPFGVANVKISYSTDGGLTFPTVLAASTANDGSQAVTIPVGPTTTGRFKVEAIGQPFFDTSHANLTVKPAGTWYLRNVNSAGSSIGSFGYGSPGDIPVAGDWNGDGTTTVGVFRPSTATWYLSGANANGALTGGFTFGSPGDIPVAGDWNGDGTTTIGVFRPSTATWYLRNANSAGTSIGGFRFGNPGDQPVAGDWDGNGTTTIGVFRPSTAIWYLRNANSAGTSTGGFTFGSKGDLAVAGDWNANGHVTIGVFRPSTATWYERNTNSAGTSTGGFRFGNTGDRPVAGDWNGDGRTTIGVFR